MDQQLEVTPANDCAKNVPRAGDQINTRLFRRIKERLQIAETFEGDFSAFGFVDAPEYIERDGIETH